MPRHPARRGPDLLQRPVFQGRHVWRHARLLLGQEIRDASLRSTWRIYLCRRSRKYVLQTIGEQTPLALAASKPLLPTGVGLGGGAISRSSQRAGAARARNMAADLTSFPPTARPSSAVYNSPSGRRILHELLEQQLARPNANSTSPHQEMPAG